MSRAEGWELGTQLIGGEVKQVLGLDSDRSSLTGVGLILREGLVLLRVVTVFLFLFFLQISIFKHYSIHNSWAPFKPSPSALRGFFTLNLLTITHSTMRHPALP